MEYECYSIAKSDRGWIICACGRALLDCRQKRTAIATTIRAKQMMLLDGDAMVQPKAIDDASEDVMRADGCGQWDK